MSTAVVAYEAASLTERREYAQTLAAAGDLIPRGLWSPVQRPDGSMGPAAPSPGKVLLVIETGAMLGLHPAAALQSINVVEGRATLSAQLIAGLIRKAGNRLEIRKTGSIPTGDYSVTVVGTITQTGEEFESTWDIPRAIRAGLVDSYRQNADGVWEVRARSSQGKAKPWESYAEVMPVWRAISEVSRFGFSDVTFGLYSTEELTDGGPALPVSEPDPEPSEDWAALIAAADTRDALEEIRERMRPEATEKLKAAWFARAGVLARDANVVDAEVLDDPEPRDEAAIAAEARAEFEDAQP
ncbi:hypothetical protein [Agromyces sp. NBRC 114283]|uniref:hypothetical protein n=1 Tax=Agromyces sp. NBRC 114283 TaxID=2994521 RepID=UPI0024A4255C|nr:hypothetical protein [Agromyces sp. NBRC 114283]GLU91313.1 hypothetical protein Agsp01_35680 [Agromyces sp. NBRC 114283]